MLIQPSIHIQFRRFGGHCYVILLQVCYIFYSMLVLQEYRIIILWNVYDCISHRMFILFRRADICVMVHVNVKFANSLSLIAKKKKLNRYVHANYSCQIEMSKYL